MAVCPCVGYLPFGLNDPWDMRKKEIFCFYEIFIFTLFMDIHFLFFSYIALLNICFQTTGHSFPSRDVIFGSLG